jgi:hypothetical protein
VTTTTPPYAIDLADQLTDMADKALPAVPVVRLAPPDQDRARDTLATVLEQTGLAPAEMKSLGGDATRTVLSGQGRERAVVFHRSGAFVVKLGIPAHERLFTDDPGDEELIGLVEQTFDRLGLRTLIPEEDQLSFERLWRVKAAGWDRAGRSSEPVLCRAIGAYRHFVHGLPVYGRASVLIELTGDGDLASVGMSMRRLADDGGGEIVAEAPVRPARDAAEEAAEEMVRAFGGLDDLRGTRLVADSFRFGYFSFGRRREQDVLAPFYIATVAVDGADERSAHMVVVRGSADKYLQIPPGEPPLP